MNVSNAVCSSMIFSGVHNQPAEPGYCEEGSRTPSDLTSGEGSSSTDTKSSTSVAKINTTRTVGLAKLCEPEASDTSPPHSARAPNLSGGIPSSFSQFDSQDVLKMLEAGTDESLGFTNSFPSVPFAAETPGKVHLLPSDRAKKLDHMTPEVFNRLADLPCLGKGSYGHVYLVNKDIKGVEKAALKKFIPKGDVLSESEHRRAAREVYTHIECNHPNVVKALAYHVGQQSVMLMMERMSCDLDQLLAQPDDSLCLTASLRILKGIFYGVEYLHKDLKLLHGDLKTGNVLLNEQLEAKITDFGFVSRIDQPRTLSREPACFYMAPELTCNQRDYMSEKTEVFCLGFIALQLLKEECLYHAWVNKPNHCRKSFSYSPELYEAYQQYFENTASAEQEKVKGKPVIASVLDASEIARVQLGERKVEEKDLTEFIQKMVWQCMSHSPESRLTLTEAKVLLMDFIDQTKLHRTRKRSCTSANPVITVKKKLF